MENNQIPEQEDAQEILPVSFDDPQNKPVYPLPAEDTDGAPLLSEYTNDVTPAEPAKPSAFSEAAWSPPYSPQEPEEFPVFPAPSSEMQNISEGPSFPMESGENPAPASSPELLPSQMESAELPVSASAEVTDDIAALPEPQDLLVSPEKSSEPAEILPTENEESADAIHAYLSIPGDTPAPAQQQPEDDAIDQEYRDNSAGFDELMQKEAEPQTPPPRRERPPQKGRPKRKRKEWFFGIPNMAVTVVWLALILAIGITAGRMLWVCASDVLAFGRPNKVVTVTIYESDSMDDIIKKLHDNELIRYKGLFHLYASISNAEEKIKPGIYDLNTLYDYHALVNSMTPRSSREVINLTIPEGYSCRQIFALLEEKRICTAQDIASYAASGELNEYWFLENVTRGDRYCLEGFLFPDTYQFYKNSTPREALQKMLDNFNIRFTEEMRAQLDALNAALTGNYTVREITIVASMIEKESAAPAESPRIAGVIYNRLFRWNGTPAYLNIDASIVYALDGKSELTREDLQIDSPFNTYTHIGLTPTPISNPGLSSLQAALQPENHNYYYYVLNPATGMHQFSTTYEEHSGYVRQFAGG